MSASKKIFIATIGLLLVAFIAGLLVLRMDLQQVIDREPQVTYEDIPVGKFQNLVFSANWDVRIQQGREHKVEWAVAETTLMPGMENLDGTLYFSLDTVANKSVRVKITAPALREIRAGIGTKIRLDSFKADSLGIWVADAGSLSCIDINIQHLAIVTSGDSRIELSKMMEN